MQNILLISELFPPAPGIGGVRPSLLAISLRKRGAQVRVLCMGEALPDDPAHVIRVSAGTASWPALFRWAVALSQTLLKLMGRNSHLNLIWRRNLRLAAREVITESRPDWIIATFPSLTALRAGAVLSRKYNIPLVADFRDGYLFESLVPMRMTKRERWLERKIVGRSSFVVTATPGISAYFESTYPAARVLTLTNGFFPEDHANAALAPSPFKGNQVNLVYTGKFFPLVPLDCLLKAIDRPFDSPVTLHLFGTQDARDQPAIQRLVESGAVVSHGLVEREKALLAQAHADLLIVGFSTTRPNVLAGKLVEYMGAGRPVLAYSCPANMLAHKEIERLGLGIAVGDDPDEIADAIKQLIANEPTARKIPPREYSWDTLGDRWAQLLEL